jgi:hypothetical protein
MLTENGSLLAVATIGVAASFGILFAFRKGAGTRGGQETPVVVVEPPHVEAKKCLHVRDQKVVESLSGYSNFASVMKLNLEMVTEDTKRAALTVLGNLSAIRSLFAGMTDFVYQNGDAARSAAAQANACVMENKELLIALKAFWARRDMEVAEYRKWLSSLMDVVHNFQGRLKEIETVSSRMKTLASTSAIDAYCTGEAGRKFDTVARETEALSRQMDKFLMFVRSSLDSVEQNIVQKGAGERFMAREDGKTKRFEGEILESLSKKVTTLGESCLKLTQHHEQVIREIDQMGSNVASKVMQSFAEIQFQDRVAQQIEMVLGALSKSTVVFDQCAAALETGSTASMTITMSDVVSSLQQEYVMESQHKQHAKALNQEYEEKVVPKVELF